MAKGYCCVLIACAGSTAEVVADDWDEHRSRLRGGDVRAHRWGRGHWYGLLGIRAGKKPSCTLLLYPFLPVRRIGYQKCVF
jgi:hypothetical protein